MEISLLELYPVGLPSLKLIVSSFKNIYRDHYSYKIINSISECGYLSLMDSKDMCSPKDTLDSAHSSTAVKTQKIVHSYI